MFHGLATPAMAFLIIIVSHILDPHRLENHSLVLIYFSLITILLGSALMDAKIKYPKIRGEVGVILALAIIISLLSIEVQKWFDINSSDTIFMYYRIVSFFGLGLIISYVFIAPLMVNITNYQKISNNTSFQLK